MKVELKRLFFGMEIQSFWPEYLPTGRLLDESQRHMTLIFLGNIYYSKIQQALLTFPIPSFKVGFAAKFDQCLFLPKKRPRVVAWHIDWLQRDAEIIYFYNALIQWLSTHGFSFSKLHKFFPHVTLARQPFNKKDWEKQFVPSPILTDTIHLYESLGNLTYTSIWSYKLLSPFEEIEHTADIAYIVRGQNYDQLYAHAALALTFNFKPLISFLQNKNGFTQLEDVIIELNRLVAYADQNVGCPFKAVSFHSQIQEKDGVLHWEMIIDV